MRRACGRRAPLACGPPPSHDRERRPPRVSPAFAIPSPLPCASASLVPFDRAALDDDVATALELDLVALHRDVTVLFHDQLGAPDLDAELVLRGDLDLLGRDLELLLDRL